LTNLHPEHIEAHGSFEKYRAAKLDFLKYVLKRGGTIFLNRGDKNFDFFMQALTRAESVMSFSRTDEQLTNQLAKIERARDRRELGAGGGSPFLLKHFNEENVAVAIAIAKELGITDRIIEEALVDWTGVPGRMEVVSERSYTAIVDYAHTPDSLAAAYTAAR